jgi:GT2 family glycosyltransferase
MDVKPKVSAIIANWNGAEHLQTCLPSLLAQSYSPLEIIVVDNASSDRSADVAESFGVKWLPLNHNSGLAPALNRGASVATGEFLLFLNNDMRFDPQFVAALVEPLETDEKIFATDGMQFNWDGTLRGHMATRLLNVRPRTDSSTELVPGLYFDQQEEAQQVPVFMASAACMMARRSYFEELGGFDGRLPLGYEDVEICWRAWTRRWKIMYVPNAVCWHRIGASGSSQEGVRFNFQGVLKGRLLLATKLLPARYALRTWMVSTVELVKDLGQLRWRFAKDRVGVLIDMTGFLPQLMREKKDLFNRTSISPGEQLDFLLGLTRKSSFAELQAVRHRNNG